MRIARPVVALDPRRFGRRAIALAMAEQPSLKLSDDARLFVSAFTAGFVAVSILIA